MFCLGIKDAFVLTRLNYEDLSGFLRLSLSCSEVPYERARSTVLGAVEYAHQLGFEPPDDWLISRPIIESQRPFDRQFKFGKDGQPFYIQGPHDDAKKIMNVLAPLLRDGKADFLIRADKDIVVDDDGFDDPMSFEDRCDEISDLLEQRLLDDARDLLQDLLEEFPHSAEPLFLMGTYLTMDHRRKIYNPS